MIPRTYLYGSTVRFHSVLKQTNYSLISCRVINRLDYIRFVPTQRFGIEMVVLIIFRIEMVAINLIISVRILMSEQFGSLRSRS